METLIYFIVAIIVIGLILWLVERFIPMDPMFRTVLRVLIAIGLILWLAYTFLGVGSPLR
jgi:hypothetical protein